MIVFQEKLLSDLSFIDLFAGIGSFHLALASLGAKCVYSNEWDLAAQEVYRQNFGETPAGDITKVDERSIPPHDILCAGFPCQPFSISGKQRGFDDSRGTLFFDVARIIRERRPKVVFLENVKNFARHDHGNTLRVVENTMAELGYDFYHQVLNAADYNVPQNRERIYMVGFRSDLGVRDFSFPARRELTRHVEDILLTDHSQLVQDLYRDRDDLRITANEVQYSNRPIRIGTVGKGGQGERVYSPKGIAITLSANGGGVFAKTGGYLIDGRVRKLHPRECANLMGFPDDFKIHPQSTQAYKQFGNSVVVDVLQLIAQQIGQNLLANS